MRITWMTRGSRNFRGGQVAIYLLVTLVALTLLALLNVDVFVSVRAKMRTDRSIAASGDKIVFGE